MPSSMPPLFFYDPMLAMLVDISVSPQQTVGAKFMLNESWQTLLTSH